MKTVALVLLWTALGVGVVVGTVLWARALMRLAEVQREKPMKERLKVAVPVAVFGAVVLVFYVMREL